MNEDTIRRESCFGEVDEVLVMGEEQDLGRTREFDQGLERGGRPGIVELNKQIVNNQR